MPRKGPNKQKSTSHLFMPLSVKCGHVLSLEGVILTLLFPQLPDQCEDHCSGKCVNLERLASGLQ